MTTYRVTQEATELNLTWSEGDDVSLSVIVEDADWSGTYTGVVRDKADPSSTQMLVLTVSASYSAPDTTFTISNTNTSDVPAGTYYWSAKTSTITRFFGTVIVKPNT